MESNSKLESFIDRKTRRKKKKKGMKVLRLPVFVAFARNTFGLSVARWLKAEPEDRSIFKRIKPPFFLMSTHNSFWGPFVLAALVPYQVSYVVNDANFRSPLMKLGLALTGAIPKTKALSDFDTIKSIFDIRKQGGVIGIYPEGQNSYDGHTIPIFASTAKLVKRMKIPVIIGDKRGSYLTFPRWAKNVRKGKILISYREEFSPEELETMSVEEIYERMKQDYTYNEFDFQRKAMIPYKGKDKAEYLEIVLFVCPHCKSVAKMVSKGDFFTCTECGYEVEYTVYGFFETKGDKLYFDNIRDWNIWQFEYFFEDLTKRLAELEEFTIFEDFGMTLSVGYKADPMEEIGRGDVTLYSDHLVFLDSDGESLSFSFSEMVGINMHNDEKLEFYFRNSLFRVDSRNKRISLYKYYRVIQYLQEKKKAAETV